MWRKSKGNSSDGVRIFFFWKGRKYVNFYVTYSFFFHINILLLMEILKRQGAMTVVVAGS